MMLFRKLAIGLIRGYQYLVSPFFPACCRFAPTCSHYAIDAFATHGVLAGVLLTLRRLLRCHPWGGEGYDPVPPRPLSLVGTLTRQGDENIKTRVRDVAPNA